MKLLVETHPTPVAELETSLVIGEANRVTDASVSEVFAAEEAISRVLTGRESRTDTFTDEELMSLRGLERALEHGEFDTNGKGMQVIPPDMSKPLLTAMELFAHIPEAEKADLTPGELSRWEIAAAALSKMDVVELEPGVSPQEAVVQIVPDLTRYDEEPTKYDYDWLYTKSDKKAAGNVPAPARRSNTTEDVDESGVRLFREAITEKAGVGVDMSDYPTGLWEPEFVTPKVQSQSMHEATQQWSPDFIGGPVKVELPPEAAALLGDTQDTPVHMKSYDDLFGHEDSDHLIKS